MNNRIRLRKVENIIYTNSPAGPLALDIYRPASDVILPALLFVHGGAWCEGNRTGAEDQIVSALLARAGYVVANIDYRLAPAHPFPAGIEDVRAAASWVGAKIGEYGGDPQRFGGFGISAGAHLIGLLATDDDSPLTCAVSWGGPMDMREIPVADSCHGYFYAFMAACPHNNPERYAEASPACRVHAKMSPMLMVHGEFDPLVPPAQATKMEDLGKLHGADIVPHIIPGGGHEPGDPRDPMKKLAWDAIISFYQRRLG